MADSASILEAARVGRRVLAALEAGREFAIERQRERGAATRSVVVAMAMTDTKGPRGLAGRVSRKLHGSVSERHVKRILDALANRSDSVSDTVFMNNHDTEHHG